ncbi:ROK family transcriptional regulator [Lentzea sp. JNUCC 0626]|uniref:ROK family transcriptional regulator n=1 Tax=Lentzea sp. JNUCC 0626 TaxID=3367513 RepID=UPI003749504B
MSATPANLRRLGRLRVLQALSEIGEVSRGDLLRHTGLSRATISSLVADLAREGLVREQSSAATRLGRPPQVVSLVPEAGYAFGLDLGHDHARLVLADLAGTPVWDDTVELDVDSSAEHAVATAAGLVEAALEDSEIERRSVLGLGVGIACPVDRRTGMLRAEGIMPAWAGAKPAEMLTGRTGLRTLVVNDANACVVAERRYGVARHCDDVVYLRLSAGIGAGVVCDGRMLLGHDGLVGELGHISVDPRGEVCRCGNRGCLETIASPAAVARLLSRSWVRTVTNTELMALLDAKDRGAVRAVEDAGEAVGRTLAMTVMTLNPQLVVVGGELAAAGAVLFEPIRQALRRNSLGDLHGELQVVGSALGDSASARGAAALVLAEAPNLLTIDKV